MQDILDDRDSVSVCRGSFAFANDMDHIRNESHEDYDHQHLLQIRQHTFSICDRVRFQSSGLAASTRTVSAKALILGMARRQEQRVPQNF